MNESILTEISPSLVKPKELYIAKINIDEHNIERLPARRSLVSQERHAHLSVALISELWYIRPKQDKATTDATKQGGIRSSIFPLSRHYRCDQMYDLKRLQGRFAIEIFLADTKLLHGNTCCEVYFHKVIFAACYPKLNAKGDSLGYYLDNLVNDFGAPDHLTFDGFSSQVGKNTRFFKKLRKYSIEHHVSAPWLPNGNPAEGSIMEIIRCFYRIMEKVRVPKRVWDYIDVWVCNTWNLSVYSSWYVNGRTAI